VHNFTLKITSARALIKARLNKGLVVSKVEKNKGLGYKTSKYGTLTPPKIHCFHCSEFFERLLKRILILNTLCRPLIFGIFLIIFKKVAHIIGLVLAKK